MPCNALPCPALPSAFCLLPCQLGESACKWHLWTRKTRSFPEQADLEALGRQAASTGGNLCVDRVGRIYPLGPDARDPPSYRPGYWSLLNPDEPKAVPNGPVGSYTPADLPPGVALTLAFEDKEGKKRPVYALPAAYPPADEGPLARQAGSGAEESLRALESLEAVLPPELFARLRGMQQEVVDEGLEVVEMVVDAARPAEVRFKSGGFRLVPGATPSIQQCMEALVGFKSQVLAGKADQDIWHGQGWNGDGEGYYPFRSDNRLGLPGQLHRISCIRDLEGGIVSNAAASSSVLVHSVFGANFKDGTFTPASRDRFPVSKRSPNVLVHVGGSTGSAHQQRT